MFSKIFKRNSQIKADEPVQKLPDRFSFMPEEEQLHFQDDITKFFQQKYASYKVDFAKGAVFEPEPNKTQYGLDSVAQIYHQATDKEKKNVVKNHFEKLFNAKKEEEKILKDVEDFQKMKKLLAVRLYPSDYEPKFYEILIHRQDIEGIVTVLTLDLPSSTTNVKHEYVKKWGIEIDELFRIALKNTFANNKIHLQKTDFIGFPVWTFEGESIYTASFVLKLEEYKEVIGKYGSLVIIPHRHTVVVYPIENRDVLKITNQLAGLATYMCKQGPGSISSHLYWYYNGTFTNLPYKIHEKKFDFYPPNAFITVLNQVAENKNEDHATRLHDLFEKMKNEAKWDMSHPMLWGYFFIDSDKKKLEKLSESLSKKKFNIVGIAKVEGENIYKLHIEKTTIHTPESLLKQIHDFEKVAKENRATFDGWDVGPVT